MIFLTITHTPFYVWAILALLVYRGVAAMRDRELTMRQFLLLPVVMTLLSLYGLITNAGGVIGLAASGAGFATTIALTYHSASIAAKPATHGFIRVPGSALPLIVILTIFLIKYVNAVALHMHPGLDQDALWAPLLRGVMGCCSGYFIGRAMKLYGAYKRLAVIDAGNLQRAM